MIRQQRENAELTAAKKPTRAIICPCNSRLHKGHCAYHEWYLPRKTQKAIADWLGVSVLDLDSRADIVTQAEVAALLTAEYDAERPPQTKE